jgi:DNA-binding transcriptional LysR family regulator
MADLNRVALFTAVVEAGGFSAAARRLGMPKASVSRGVALLEAELGARLLNRTTRRLELTAPGRAYYDAAAQGLARLEEARDAISAAQAEPSGTLRVTAPVDFGSQYLMAWIPEFLAQWDRVRIELQLTDAYVDLLAARIDVAFRTGRLADSSFIARRLASTRRVLLASPAYLAAHGTPESVGDLARHRCVVFGPLLDGAVWRLEGPDGRTDVRVSGRLAVDSAHAALAGAIAGLGIALLPKGVAADALAAGRLRQVLAGFGIEGGLYAVHPSNRHPPAALRAFLDFAARKATCIPG